ncbi:hypothetical protein V2J09_003429 [Rumex salicifolius]
MATFLLALCYLTIVLLALILIFTLPFSPFSNKNGVPRDWPVLGMLPALVANYNNILDWATAVANTSGHDTFMIKGPLFSNLNLLLTMDPANVQYTSSTRFSNFPRGPKSKENFDLFGDGYFNLDSNEWLAHRKIHRSFFSHRHFNAGSTRLTFEKAEKGIAVVLDHVAKGGHLGSGCGGVVDLQDLFSRYTYDLTHRLIVGHDPHSLAIDWPLVPLSKAMNSAMQGVWMRHFLPEPLWKLQRQLGIGHEKALRRAKDILNKISTMIVLNKHDEFNSQDSDTLGDDKFNDMLTTYFMVDDHYHSGDGDDVLKGSFLSLMLAGKDTTAAALTWFFWIISQHPTIEVKIRAEVEGVISKDVRDKGHVFTPEEISKLFYLHASIYETLRLYPPVPFQTRAPREPDMLPSGHEVFPNSTMVIIPLYVMARMKSVWGKDCAEFKPERWIAEDGGFKHEPSHKFFTFNSGPRICLGREVALNQMKAAIATILYNYNVHILKEQKVVPVYSVVLQTKYGLQARVSRRWV